MCLSVVYTALKDMEKKETFIACKKNVWPESIQIYEGFSSEDIQHEPVNNAVELAKLHGQHHARRGQ